MARAFRSERIMNVIESNDQPIAINLIIFGDTANVQIPWVILRTRDDVLRVSTIIEYIPKPDHLYTNILGALNLSLNTFDTTPCESDDKIIDISADGIHNTYPGLNVTVESVVERAVDMGIRINTLPIVTSDPEEPNEYVYEYLNNNFAIPTGGFSIRSTGFQDFHRAIFQKLSMEIAAR
jgi:hypothetical protein